MIILVIVYMFCFNYEYLTIPKFLLTEVVVNKKTIKYIEKSGMDTKDFVKYLNPRIDPVVAEKIGNAVDKYSKKYQLPRKLILSIIKKESSFNPLAKSSVAFGLMQIYPKFHLKKIEALGIKDQRKLYHIDININIGCQIFREYFDKSKGDLDETFHKYLSKKATKKQRDRYKNKILTTWAEIDLYEYLTKKEKEKEKENEKEKRVYIN